MIIKQIAAFLKSIFSLRLLLGLLLVVSTVFTIIYTSKYLDAKRAEAAKTEAHEAKEKQLSVASIVRIWDTLEIPQIKVKSARLKTKYSDGLLKYQLSVEIEDGFNFLAFKQVSKPFSIVLSGEDEFDILSFELTSSSMTEIVDDDGKRFGIDYSGYISAPLEKYLAAKDWRLLWRF